MATDNIEYQEIIKQLQVSRETINSLKIYEDFLLENNRKFNLISKSD